MAISGDNALSQLISALGNNFTQLNIDKVSVANTAATQWHSLWRATGVPGQGAIPTAVASCDHTLLGAIGFAQQTAPATSYLGQAEGFCTTAGTTIEFHDRLAHMGGLNGTLTTAQTVNLDLNALLASDNIDARKGAANFSDVLWWLEWYADTGATNTSITVNVTYNDGTTGNLTATGNIGTARRASQMIPLNYLIPAAASGKFIRGVNSVTLSASTGTAGNFGVTATVPKGSIYKPLANVKWPADWATLGLPRIHNESCLFAVQLANATSSGIVRVTGKIAHG
jgi:hypothetical protein